MPTVITNVGMHHVVSGPIPHRASVVRDCEVCGIPTWFTKRSVEQTKLMVENYGATVRNLCPGCGGTPADMDLVIDTRDEHGNAD